MTQDTLPGRDLRTAEDTPRPRDLRRISRVFAAVLMPVGPLAVALLRFLLPYNSDDSPKVSVAKIAAHPGRERIVLWLLVLAFLTLVPGVYAAIKLASRRAPILAAVSACLVIPGYLALSGVGLIDNVGIAAASTRTTPGTVGVVADIVNDLPTTNVLSVIFVAGHLIGTIVLSVALWRARVLAVAGALVLGVSQPLHLIAVVISSHWLDLIGWSMTAVGMALIALATLRTPDEEWDLPPALLN